MLDNARRAGEQLAVVQCDVAVQSAPAIAAAWICNPSYSLYVVVCSGTGFGYWNCHQNVTWGETCHAGLVSRNAAELLLAQHALANSRTADSCSSSMVTLTSSNPSPD
jgi:hypothetical protein